MILDDRMDIQSFMWGIPVKPNHSFWIIQEIDEKVQGSVQNKFWNLLELDNISVLKNRVRLIERFPSQEKAVIYGETWAGVEGATFIKAGDSLVTVGTMKDRFWPVVLDGMGLTMGLGKSTASYEESKDLAQRISVRMNLPFV